LKSLLENKVGLEGEERDIVADSLIDWLKAFLSYGFVLCVDSDKTDRVLEKFSKKNITAHVIGTVTQERKFLISSKGRRDILFDFEKEDITGVSKDQMLIESLTL